MPWMSDDDLLRMRAAMEAAIPHLNTYAAQLARYPVDDCHEAIRLREAIAMIDTVRTRAFVSRIPRPPNSRGSQPTIPANPNPPPPIRRDDG